MDHRGNFVIIFTANFDNFDNFVLIDDNTKITVFGMPFQNILQYL